MSGKTSVMTTHHHCRDKMPLSANLSSQLVDGNMSGVDSPSEVENLFWSKTEMLHERPEALK